MLRVAFIGCGGIAQYHFSHFEQMQDKAKIVACCDLLEERRNAAAVRFEAVPYADYREVLAKEKIDALYVCVPPYCHDGMELLAAEKGIHLFVQKPMTLDWSYAEEVLKAVRASGVVNTVGLQCRYADSLDFVKSWLDHQEIGTVHGFRYGPPPLVAWWRQMAKSGGQAVEQTIHDFDISRYFFGEVVQVQAVARRGMHRELPGFDVDDATMTLLTFESGVIESFGTGCFGKGPSGIDIYCADDRKVHYTYPGDYRIEEPFRTIEGKAGNDYGMECDETFVDVCLGNLDREELKCDYEEACRTLALTLAINESAAQGGIPVKPRM